jgi:hypothetical protein
MSKARKGTAFWLPDRDADLMRALSTVESRTFPAIMHRALALYAAQSTEYQGVQPCAASSLTTEAFRPSNTAS